MSETKLHVKLLRYIPNPEELIAMAAKLCYSPSNIDDLEAKISKTDLLNIDSIWVKINLLGSDRVEFRS